MNTQIQSTLTSQNDLYLVPRRVQLAILCLLLASLALNLIVAVGNWQLYSRVEKLETILGLPAKQQSQQKSSSEQSQQTPALNSNAVFSILQQNPSACFAQQFALGAFSLVPGAQSHLESMTQYDEHLLEWLAKWKWMSDGIKAPA